MVAGACNGRALSFPSAKLTCHCDSPVHVSAENLPPTFFFIRMLLYVWKHRLPNIYIYITIWIILRSYARQTIFFLSKNGRMSDKTSHQILFYAGKWKKCVNSNFANDIRYRTHLFPKNNWILFYSHASHMHWFRIARSRAVSITVWVFGKNM